MINFELIPPIEHIEIIAVGTNIRELSYLQKTYGKGRWRKLKGTSQVRLPNGRIRTAEIHWYEAHGIGRRDILWIKTMNNEQKHFVLCIDNTGYEASLIPRKVYEVLPDEDAAQDDFIRIIDESGEDYLYHAGMFISVNFPLEIQQVLCEKRI